MVHSLFAVARVVFVSRMLMGISLLHACTDAEADSAANGTCMELPICSDGALVRYETVCCTDGKYACEWDGSPRVCADRSCVSFRSRCPEDPPPPPDSDASFACVATPHKVCDHGVIREQIDCCPLGVGCGSGLAEGFCADGSCTDVGCSQDSSDADGGATPDCTPVVYSTCIKGELREQHACCPFGTTCDFGDPIVVCPDRSCATDAASCP